MRRTSQEFHKKMALKKEENHNRELGAAGEKKARKYLTSHGWKIIAKNYKNPDRKSVVRERVLDRV